MWTEEGNSTNPWLSASEKNVAFGQGLANLRRLCIHKRAVQDFYGFRAESKKRPNYCPAKKLRFLFPPPNSKTHLLGFLPPGSKKSGGNIDLSMAVTSISPPRRMNRILSPRFPLPSLERIVEGPILEKKRENLFSLFHALPPSRKEEAGRERRNIAVLSKETKNRKGKSTVMVMKKIVTQ